MSSPGERLGGWRSSATPRKWRGTSPGRAGNNGGEADHGRRKTRLRPMRGLKQDKSARVVIAGHALVQNIRRGHYELAVDEPTGRRLMVAFGELAMAICYRTAVAASA